MITGSHGAAQFVSGAWRGAQIAVLLKEAQRGSRTEIAMKVIEEESRPETPPMTEEEGMESEIAETIEKEVRVGLCLNWTNNKCASNGD